MTTTNVTTRQQWIDFAGGERAAIEFENDALSIGDEFLPPFAITARQFPSTEPAPRYWSWLAGQLRQSRNESA